ncbi:hypothetical protein Tco_0464792 [Tanacetum coccineum]
MAAISNVPQLVDKKGGIYSDVAPRLDPRKFNKWKKHMLCYLTRMEPYYSDEEEVSDDEEEIRVQVLMALADDELSVGKNHARNGNGYI